MSTDKINGQYKCQYKSVFFLLAEIVQITDNWLINTKLHYISYFPNKQRQTLLTHVAINHFNKQSKTSTTTPLHPHPRKIDET